MHFIDDNMEDYSTWFNPFIVIFMQFNSFTYEISLYLSDMTNRLKLCVYFKSRQRLEKTRR